MQESKRIVFDIETNGLLPDLDRIHCMSMYRCESNQWVMCDQDNQPIPSGVFELAEADVLIGHNILGFDIPAIEKLYPDLKFKGKLIDTYIWAACTWPNIKQTDFKRFNNGTMPGSLIGKHTLESYGYRLGILKGEFHKTTDWQEWSPEMSEYCEDDVKVNVALLDKLEQKNVSWEQVELEMDVYKILSRQEQRGVYFNKLAAENLYTDLAAKREVCREKIQKEFPPFYKRKGKLFTPKRDMRKRAGEWVGYVAGCPHQKIELVEFNPASAAHISRMFMQKYDWIPHEYADAQVPSVELQAHYDRLGIDAITVPKIDEDVLKQLKFEECDALIEFMTLNKRCSQIGEGKQAWLKKLDLTTSRIHHVCYQFGTVTGRCSHFGPNLGQVPANYSLYGKECRALFMATPGMVMVGCDADGLEARCLAHYIHRYDDGALIKVILEGNKSDGTDIHSLNRDRIGLDSRNVAKTFFYAFIYGAGNLKLGLTAREDKNFEDSDLDPAELGNQLRERLLSEFPGLKQLTDAVKKAAKRGWLRGLDGRRIPVRNLYSALNTLLQSAGAVIMKKAQIIQHELCSEQGLEVGKDYHQTLFVHDEHQFECPPEHAEIVGQASADAIRLAGEHFNFNCPLDGSYDIGANWSETH